MNNKPFLAKFSKQAASAAHPSHLFQEFEHNTLLHDHGVELQDEQQTVSSNDKKSSTFGRRFIGSPIKARYKKVASAINFLEIFDEEKELKARFKARHI